MKCCKCGTELSSNAKFCYECGASQKNKAEYCVHCGSKLNKNSKFCSECGESVLPLEKEQKQESKAVYVANPIKNIPDTERTKGLGLFIACMIFATISFFCITIDEYEWNIVFIIFGTLSGLYGIIDKSLYNKSIFANIAFGVGLLFLGLSTICFLAIL